MLVNDEAEAKTVAQLQHCQSAKVFIIQVQATLALRGSSNRWKAHDVVKFAATSSEGSTGEGAPHGCLSIKISIKIVQKAARDDELACHVRAEEAPYAARGVELEVREAPTARESCTLRTKFRSLAKPSTPNRQFQ